MSLNCLVNLTEKLKLADTHAHLHSEAFNGATLLTNTLKAATARGLNEVWLMSLDQISFQRNLEIITFAKQRAPELKLRLGVGFDMEIFVPGSDIFDIRWFQNRPEEIATRTKSLLEQMAEEAAEQGQKIDLLGEVGLDHFRLLQQPYMELSSSEIKHSQALQRELLWAQLEFAAEHGLPVSLHSRGAENDCIDLVSDFQRQYPSLSGIFHSFTGNALQFRQIIEQLGWYVGINGIITYKSALSLRQMVVNRIRQQARPVENQKTEWQLTSEPAFARRAEGKAVGSLQPRNNPQFNKQVAEQLAMLYKSGLVLETDAPYLVPSNTNPARLPQVGGRPVNIPSTVLETLENLFSAVYDVAE